MTRLLIEADDFGLTPAVSGCILQLEQEGVVTTTNCMPTIPGFIDSVRLAEAAKRTEMGIHFILDRHLPASSPDNIPSLVTSKGNFRSWTDFQRAVGADQINLNDVRVELNAQIDLATRAGIIVDHITTHHAFLLETPALLELVSSIAIEKGLPIRNSVVSAPETTRKRLEQVPEWSQLRKADAHINLSHKDDAAAEVEEALHHVPEGETLEIVSHPGIDTPLLHQRSSLNTERKADAEHLRALVSTLPADVRLVGVEGL